MAISNKKQEISSQGRYCYYLPFGLDGGEYFCKSCCRTSTNNRSVLLGKNSGAVVAKKMSFFEAINWSFGIVMVCIKLPFTIKRISMEFEVKAITYGKAHTRREKRRHIFNDFSEIIRDGWIYLLVSSIIFESDNRLNKKIFTISYI